MHVSEIMRSKPQTIGPNATLFEAAKKMESFDVGALPVWDSGKVIGVLTDRDIVIRALATGKDINSTYVKDIMTMHPISCKEADDLETAVHKMNEKHMRRILVTDSNNTLTGILSLGDIARHLHDKRLLGELFSEVSVM